MPTIEEGFPWLTGGVKRGYRSRSYSYVSDAELNRFLGALSGFTRTVSGGTPLYKKSIPYGYLGNTPITYDAVVTTRPLGAAAGGGHLVVLSIENEDEDVDPGHVWSGLFNDIFGKIGGVFSHAEARRTFDGDRHSSFYSYSFKLEEAPYRFKITPTEPEDREAGNIDATKEDSIARYTWGGGTQKASYGTFSIGVWLIRKKF
jgi:hypothetical protein